MENRGPGSEHQEPRDDKPDQNIPQGFHQGWQDPENALRNEAVTIVVLISSVAPP